MTAQTTESDHEMNQTMTEPETAPVLKTEAVDAWLTPGRFALLLALLVVAAFPDVLLQGKTFVARDFGAFSYPVAFYHRQCFWRGEIPLWNPLNFCGVPFLAQWNTMTLYPGSLIYLLLPMPWSLSFFCLAHLFWGGLGMYFLARRWTGNCLAAGLAGIIFSFNGLMLNFLMWPSHVATFGWLPWVLWLVPEGWRQGGRKLVWGILAGSMQMLAGGPETILFTWLILFLLMCGEWITFSKRTYAEIPDAGARNRIPLRFLCLAVLVTLVCAAQLLPFLELVAHSDRDASYSAHSPNWSMPIWGWLNFLVPLFRTRPASQGIFFQPNQDWTSSYYAGTGTVLLTAVALGRRREWKVRLLAVAALSCLLLALGNRGYVYPVLHRFFPPVGFFRYPVKFLILVLASAPLLAAGGLAALTRNDGTKLGRFEVSSASLILVLVGAVLAFAWGHPIPGEIRVVVLRNGCTRAGLLVLGVLAVGMLIKSTGPRRT
ncbi:MAG TPA: hypothetical protein VG146_18585, partial [Verrucomicrobiae bacterium]|nr:hypothetical protein [Verrucomicrobiae bacterium]